MASMRRGIRRVAVALVAFVVWGAHGGADAQDLLERAKETGKVRVGYVDAPPFGFTAADGRLTGEAPEIARLVLSEMGIKEIEGVLTEPASLIADLEAGRFDMIAAGMIVMPRRCEEIAFSEPTFQVAEAFLVRAGNPEDLETFEDVAASGDAVVAVSADAIEGDLARRSGVPEERILVVPDAAAGMSAVRSGKADAFATTDPAASRMIEDKSPRYGLERTDAFTTTSDGEPWRAHGAFAFRKADAAFAAEFNRRLESFVGSSGHLAVIEPFGLTEANLPERTTADLCEPVS